MLNLESKKPLLAEMEKRQLEVVCRGTSRNRLLKSPGQWDEVFALALWLGELPPPNQFLSNAVEVNGLA